MSGILDIEFEDAPAQNRCIIRVARIHTICITYVMSSCHYSLSDALFDEMHA